MSAKGGGIAKVVKHHHRDKMMQGIGVAALAAVPWWLGRDQRGGTSVFELIALVLLGGFGFVHLFMSLLM